MSKKNGFYRSADSERECVECSRMFKPNNRKQQLCYQCDRNIKKAYKKESKKRKWYNSQQEELNDGIKS